MAAIRTFASTSRGENGKRFVHVTVMRPEERGIFGGFLKEVFVGGQVALTSLKACHIPAQRGGETGKAVKISFSRQSGTC